MTPLSNADALTPLSLPQIADASDARNFRRLILFRLDDAVRDARLGQAVVTWLPKKNTPLTALARYRAQHPDVHFDIESDKTRLRVSLCLAEGSPVQ